MEKANIFQQQTLKITSGKKSQSIELGADIIEAGFLNKFPGPTLAIFLYLVTHFDKNQYYITTRIQNIEDNIPYNKKTIHEGLEYLENNDIIMINRKNNSSKNLEIYFDFEQLADLEQTDSDSQKKQPKQTKKTSQKTDNKLFEQLKAFIPDGYNKNNEHKLLKEWLQDFDHKVVAELIRRVQKWQKNNNHNQEQVYRYLKKISQDWYDKKIFSYERLQQFDRMYRETRELAQTYGIKNWNNVTPVHMNTFHSWLTEDFSLSIEVAKFAIQTAIKRKSDGQPSLKYIEDNYINPWKKAQIKTVAQAKSYMQKSNNSYKQTQKSEKTTDTWEQFPWQIEKTTQGGVF